MRHEAAGITTAGLPQNHPIGRRGLPGHYLHEPGDARDGVTVTVPLVCAQPGERRALRMAGARHAQRQDPGAAQKPAAAPAQPLCAAARIGHPPGRRAVCARPTASFGTSASLTDVLLKKARDETSAGHQAHRFQTRDAQPAPVHEPVRGGRARPPVGPWAATWARSKAELGRQGTRGAFQALAQLKVASSAMPASAVMPANAGIHDPDGHPIKSGVTKGQSGATKEAVIPASHVIPANLRVSMPAQAQPPPNKPPSPPSATPTWTFGELPELMEISKGGQHLDRLSGAGGRARRRDHRGV